MNANLDRVALDELRAQLEQAQADRGRLAEIVADLTAEVQQLKAALKESQGNMPERSAPASALANASWAKTPDRQKRTANGRAAFEARFEKQVDPDGTMTPEAREKATEEARKEHYRRMARRSAEVRRQKAGEAS